MIALPVRCLVCSSLMLLVGAAEATDFELDQSQSSATQSLVIGVPFAGTLIGNYDSKANPEGTQTRPGLFGGSGNNPIDYSAQFDMSGETVSGAQRVAVDHHR